VSARSRVLQAFEHTQPDRTPFFEKLIKSPIADRLLGRPCAATNFDYQMQRLADGDWRGLQEQSARDLVDLAVMLGFDIIRLHMNGLPPDEASRPRRLGPGRWRIGGVVTELLPTGWLRSKPIEPGPVQSEQEQEERLRHDLRAEPAEPSLDERQFAMLRHAKRLMAEEGLDLAVFSEVYGIGVATLPPFVLRWFATDPGLIHRYFQRQQVACAARCRWLAAEGVDVIGLGGDLASDLGPMVSPAHYRELVMPYVREQARLCRRLGAKSTNATDGDIWSIADDFLLGSQVDGYEEIDFAAGMDMATLKHRYGESTTLVGNIDIRHTLTGGRPEAVRQHTVDCIRAGWGNGGHVLMSSNCIHESCRLDLFVQYVNAYRDYFGLPAISV